MEQLELHKITTELQQQIAGMTGAQLECLHRVLRLLTTTSGSIYNQVCSFMDEVGKGCMTFPDIVTRLDELEQAATVSSAAMS